MSSSGVAVDSLQALGFSDIEARIYLALLKESPQTGYGIARAIGKPTANTYKALDALADKGAIVFDDGATRQCRAVPAEELLGRLAHEFQTRSAVARKRLADIGGADGDDRIYQLRSVEQIVQRAKEMLGRAERIVLIDVFPKALALIADELVAAAARKVRVYAHLYAKRELPGVVAVSSRSHAYSLKRWPGEQLGLVVDAQEHLMCLLAEDLGSAHQAIWSQSLFMSCMQHNHLACEFELTLHRAREEGGATAAAAPRVAIEDLHLVRGGFPGFRKLVERVGR